jgi:ribosomal protein S12 methylthiotransferase
MKYFQVAKIFIKNITGYRLITYIGIGVSNLGCPKNLIDSERILTQLRAEGYDVINSNDAAELVIVNTCGFIDSGVQKSLDTIGETLAANGKVLVTGCLGV